MQHHYLLKKGIVTKVSSPPGDALGGTLASRVAVGLGREKTACQCVHFYVQTMGSLPVLWRSTCLPARELNCLVVVLVW